MLIVIGGPTGSGKSELCCLLAKHIDGEIISADSMCVYKHMDIGTAKPLGCMKSVRHHLVDVVEPGELFDAKLFEELSSKAIEDIQKRGKSPILCGGTYLYIQAVLYGIEDTPLPDWKLRHRLYEVASKEGSEYLYQKLRTVDPVYAKKISPKDTRRIVRALEVYINSGKPFSSFHSWDKPKRNFIGFYVFRSWESLQKRIEERAKAMLEEGLIEELRKLLQMGFESFLTSSQAIGYKEFIPFIKGVKSLEECLSETVKNTKEYAKRQMRWFRKQGWIEVNMENFESSEVAVRYILAHLRSTQDHGLYP